MTETLNEYYKDIFILIAIVSATAIPLYLTFKIDFKRYMKKAREENPTLKEWVLKGGYNISAIAWIVILLISVLIFIPSLILLTQHFNP